MELVFNSQNLTFEIECDYTYTTWDEGDPELELDVLDIRCEGMDANFLIDAKFWYLIEGDLYDAAIKYIEDIEPDCVSDPEWLEMRGYY